MKTTPLRWLVPVACACLAVSAHALYKVVGPDGRVTYTDVPPAAPGSRAAPVAADAAPTPGAPQVSLPYALRQAVTRYPVTLYAGPGCTPCDNARQWLRERGVPFAEKTVTTNDDVTSYTQIAGSPDLPALTIGGQLLKGLSRDEWARYLDAAGYPGASQLPPNYRYPAAVPLVARKEAAPAAAPAAALPSAPPAPANPDGFRF